MRYCIMKYTRILILLAVLAMLVACGIDNTMYNAKNYFKSAQGRALNANGRPTPQAVDEYTKAIQKCGIVLSRNSTGKRADDALFLMARALFYKKNSAFQAKDAFESLIAGFPDSRHIPDAYIYLARVLREVNQPAQSEAVLERFVRDPKYIKHHARALLVLADFEIGDEDYIRAQFWLERIIRDYRSSDEFKDAYFLFGKNYYMQKEYDKSLAEYQTFINTRGIPRERKLEARYYIALNLYELGRYSEALREIRYVNRVETRPDMLSKARVLYGRALLSEGFEEDGLAELEAVTKTYPRTEHAAAAYYYWGSYLYYQKGSLDAAVTHLNRVRTEFSASVFAPRGMRLANAISQSKSTRKLDSSRNLQEFLDFHYLRAESFLGAIALPDSALASYRRVIAERDSFAVQADSLRAQIMLYNAELDSLLLLVPDVPEELADPLIEPDLADADEPQDSLLTVSELLEEIELAVDSLAVLPEASAITAPLADSLQTEDFSEALTVVENEEIPLDMTAEADSLSPLLEDFTKNEEGTQRDTYTEQKPEDDPLAVARDRIVVLRQNIGHIEVQLAKFEEPLNRFDTEIIPFCKYSIFSILRSIPGREPEAEEIYREMLQDSSRNMYTIAAAAVLAGRTPTLADPDLEEAEASFDLALDYYPQAPDSLVTAMQEFTESEYEVLRVRANYRLAWFYSFEQPDTSLAKPYLDAVLEDSAEIIYADAVRRFYDGRQFLKREANYTYLEIADSLTIEAAAEMDSLIPDLADSLSVDISLPEADSLKWESVPPVEADSLSHVPGDDPEPEEEGGEPEPSPNEQAPQDIIPPREEDTDS
jgi:TolA-binding protein